jgi:uncharacterized protein YggE
MGSRLLVIILCAASTLIAASMPSYAQGNAAEHSLLGEQSKTGIVVSGECLTKVTPDRGSVTLGTSIVAASSREASEKAVKAHESIKKAVKDLSLTHFAAETAEYSVQEECSYHEGKRRCQGFRARLATRFETSDIARLGDIIGVGSSSNAEEVSELSIFPSQDSMKAARESCLEVAMKNASAKAQKLATGAGVTLGALLSVVEGGASNEPPTMPVAGSLRRFEAAVMSQEPGSSPSIDTKPTDLRVQITARYALR